jgi:hypothetical protein
MKNSRAQESFNENIMSKNNSGFEQELQQMYARAEHWVSDYAFFEDEIRFLMNLLDKYFVALIISDSAKLDVLQSKARQLVELDNQRESVAKENQDTLLTIAKLLKNEISFDPQEFREEYADVENSHVGFLKRYQRIKKEIFDLSEQLQATGKT